MRKNVLTVFTNPLDAEAKHTEKFKTGKGTFTCWQTWSGTKQNRTGTGKTKDSYDNTYANVRVRVKMEGKSYNPNTYSEKRCRKTDTVAKAEKKGNIEYSYIMFPYYYQMYGYIFGDGMKNVVNNGKPVLCPGPVNLAVCSKSDKKDGVYEFLNFVFDDSNHYLITDFPALKINEEDWKDRLTATKNYINRYGNSVTVQNFQMNVGEFFCEIPSLTEDEYASYEEFIHSAEYIEPMPDKYLDIIMEEADLYFTDKKSLDDTMKSIENRVNNALNE